MANWPREKCPQRKDTPSSDPGERSSGRSLAGMAARGRMSLHLKTGVKKAVTVGFEFQPLLSFPVGRSSASERGKPTSCDHKSSQRSVRTQGGALHKNGEPRVRSRV